MAEKILVTQKGCGGCEGVKKALSEAISKGEIREVAITSDEGNRIADELDLDWVPECVEKSADGKYTKCSLDNLIKEKGK